MSETRVTVPFDLSALDLFIPSTMRFFTDVVPENTVEKSIVHDYVLLSDTRINLKLTQDGRAFDLKWLLTSKEDGLLEEWVGCAKGPLSKRFSFEELGIQLQKALESAAPGSPEAEGLKVTTQVFDPTAPQRIAHTEKTNFTCKGSKMTLEQINFSVHLVNSTDLVVNSSSAVVAKGPVLKLRSMSVEGEYDAKAAEKLRLAAHSKHADSMVVGGFPKMLNTFLAPF
ncbi:hypothetical protein CEUSTIGMA_g10321.t1 [Chlamydomonas eustigma]|uniref:Uncharacterized protein n=1 Tax=Chlamydomonas eustigma TaxID=1157962 RepID=A0A250XII2_9CHLO|nr:hypothetical protein CEUSTIGMA_g10321.t1 [Chlamydomonas eustigma]|eukprot:GAX82895.1 hypothetical protein CEUSTIGMA_g10321.t1 [Chlamydomonas eustigma]